MVFGSVNVPRGEVPSVLPHFLALHNTVKIDRCFYATARKEKKIGIGIVEQMKVEVEKNIPLKTHCKVPPSQLSIHHTTFPSTIQPTNYPNFC